MSIISVSSDVLSYCGSCKMDLMSTVVARANGKVVKVQCRTCKKEHGYRPPKGVKDPNQTPSGQPTRKLASKPKASGLSEEKSGRSVRIEWQEQMTKHGQIQVKPYSPQGQFEVHDVIAHSSFGKGIVQKMLHPDKIEVLFEMDLKTLMHRR